MKEEALDRTLWRNRFGTGKIEYAVNGNVGLLSEFPTTERLKSHFIRFISAKNKHSVTLADEGKP